MEYCSVPGNIVIQSPWRAIAIIVEYVWEILIDSLPFLISPAGIRVWRALSGTGSLPSTVTAVAKSGAEVYHGINPCSFFHNAFLRSLIILCIQLGQSVDRAIAERQRTLHRTLYFDSVKSCPVLLDLNRCLLT